MVASYLTDPGSGHIKLLGDLPTIATLVVFGLVSAVWATRSGYVTEEILSVLKSERELGGAPIANPTGNTALTA